MMDIIASEELYKMGDIDEETIKQQANLQTYKVTNLQSYKLQSYKDGRRRRGDDQAAGKVTSYKLQRYKSPGTDKSERNVAGSRLRE